MAEKAYIKQIKLQEEVDFEAIKLSFPRKSFVLFNFTAKFKPASNGVSAGVIS